MDKISLVGMAFYGYHGLREEEKHLGQRFIVDAEVSGDFSKSATADSLDDGFNYSQLFQLVKKIVEGRSFNLIEALALRLCEAIISEFPIIRQVTVRVKKPEAPLPGILEGPMVEFTRRRHDARQ